MILREFQCVEGFQACTNVTFTQNSIGNSLQYGYSLPPGNGCYIQIDRMKNGSIGSMMITYDDPQSILVFDNQQQNYQSGVVLGMPVSSYGWAPRKVFVVNRGSSQVGFSAQFVGGVLQYIQSSVLLIGLAIGSLLIAI